jgi:hypothetical protein
MAKKLGAEMWEGDLFIFPASSYDFHWIICIQKFTIDVDDQKFPGDYDQSRKRMVLLCMS